MIEFIQMTGWVGIANLSCLVVGGTGAVLLSLAGAGATLLSKRTSRAG